jgi:hypothetical protein
MQKFCQEGKNKGKPGPCPDEGKQTPKKSLREKIRDQLDAAHGKLLEAGAAAKGEIEKAKQENLKKPEKTPFGRILDAATRKPEEGEKLTLAKRAKEAAAGYVKQTLDERMSDWKPVFDEAKKFATDQRTVEQAGKIAGRLSAAVAGPYVRQFKLYQAEFGTPAAIAMSAASGTSMMVTGAARTAIFATTGVRIPGFADYAVPSLVYGTAKAIQLAHRYIPKIAMAPYRVWKAEEEKPDWAIRAAEGDNLGASDKAKILNGLKQMRATLGQAIGAKLPPLTDEQLWAIYVYESRRNRSIIRKHSDSPQKFCQEGPNKGKPGPCPDPERKAKRAATIKSGPPADVGPTNAAPGSDEKIRVLQARFAKKLPLFDPKDGSTPAKKPIREQKKSMSKRSRV